MQSRAAKFAVMALLHRNELDTSLVEPWLKRLGEGIKPPRTRGPLYEWPSAEAANTSRLLRALHLQLALGVQGRPGLHRDEQLFAERCPSPVIEPRPHPLRANLRT